MTSLLQEESLQATVDEARAKGAHAVVLLSHNGMDVDLKLASRVTGIDVILGGHTHDAVPDPMPVKNRGGVSLVTNAGCNGKFLAVLDLDVRGKRVAGWAPVAEGASGQPVWEIVTAYLRRKKVIRPPKLILPQLNGVSGNPGIADPG